MKKQCAQKHSRKRKGRKTSQPVDRNTNSLRILSRRFDSQRNKSKLSSADSKLRKSAQKDTTARKTVLSLLRTPPERLSTVKNILPVGEQIVAQSDLIVSSILKQQSISEVIPQKHKIKESMDAFLLNQRSENTRRAYQKDLKRFYSYVLMLENEKKVPVPFSRSTVIGYKEMLLSEGLEHTTIDRHLATLRSFFRWIKEDGLIQHNPLEGVRFLKPRRLSKTIGFSNEEVNKILALPDLHTRVGAQHYAILMVLFYCGLRRAELCSLKTTHLSKEREKWVFRLTGKGNKERFVVLTPSTWNSIRYLFRITGRNFNEDSYIFRPVRTLKGDRTSGRVERPFDPSMIFYIVRKYARLAGISSRVSPHSCRATAISNARDHHVPDRAIQEFAGWASPDMITRYDKRKSAVEDSASLSIKYGSESSDRIQSYHFEITPDRGVETPNYSENENAHLLPIHDKTNEPIENAKTTEK